MEIVEIIDFFDKITRKYHTVSYEGFIVFVRDATLRVLSWKASTKSFDSTLLDDNLEKADQ